MLPSHGRYRPADRNHLFSPILSAIRASQLHRRRQLRFPSRHPQRYELENHLRLRLESGIGCKRQVRTWTRNLRDDCHRQRWRGQSVVAYSHAVDSGQLHAERRSVVIVHMTEFTVMPTGERTRICRRSLTLLSVLRRYNLDARAS
jgi:hypothetical protein